MKKWIWGVAGALLIWNLILTMQLFQLQQSGVTSTHLIPAATADEKDQGNVHSIDRNMTDLKTAVTKIQSQMVTVLAGGEGGSTYSGIVYMAADGKCWIVTSRQGSGSEHIQVCFDNGILAEASICGSDEATGIALLVCEPPFETPAISHGNPSLVKAGEYVIALSGRSALVQAADISFGVITAPLQVLCETGQGEKWISEEFSGDLRMPKTSTGGALCNMSGQLIGMIIPSEAGGFRAVTNNEIEEVVRQWMENKQITRGYLGALTRDLDDLETYAKSALNIALDQQNGVVFIDGETDSPAVEAGLEAGDVIVKLDEQIITDRQALRQALYRCTPGQQVTLEGIRGQQEIHLTVVLQ